MDQEPDEGLVTFTLMPLTNGCFRAAFGVDPWVDAGPVLKAATTAHAALWGSSTKLEMWGWPTT